MGKICKASLLTFFSKKVREKGVCGKVPKALRPRRLGQSFRPEPLCRFATSPRNARSLLQPPLTGEVAERSDGRRGFLPLPASTGLPEKHRAGHARPLQRSKSKARSHHRRGRRPRRSAQQHSPRQVIFNARCTRYTMYLNSPAIRLNSTQT